jgi:hypothetical protein
MFVLLVSEAAVLVGSGISSRVIYAEKAKAVSGSIVNEFLLYVRFECRKGVNFEAVMPISNKYLNHLTLNYNLPTFGSLNFSAFSKSSGDQIKSIIHIIEHPVVLDGQRSPSSSEDG